MRHLHAPMCGSLSFVKQAVPDKCRVCWHRQVQLCKHIYKLSASVLHTSAQRRPCLKSTDTLMLFRLAVLCYSCFPGFNSVTVNLHLLVCDAYEQRYYIGLAGCFSCKCCRTNLRNLSLTAFNILLDIYLKKQLLQQLLCCDT